MGDNRVSSTAAGNIGRMKTRLTMADTLLPSSENFEDFTNILGLTPGYLEFLKDSLVVGGSGHFFSDWFLASLLQFIHEG